MNKISRTLGFILSHPLGKRHPVKSISRFLLWQVQGSLFPSRLIVKDFIKPVKFYARKSLTGITGNIYAGLHEFDDMAFLLHLLREEDVFFDIGANAGSYTLLASGIGKAKTIAIEPVPSTFAILLKNIGLNSLSSKVTLINAGAGAVEGTINFSSNQDTTNHVIAANEASMTGIISVPVITIDSLIQNDSPVLVKMDVEGYETEVLKGMKATLELTSLKAIIIELNGSGDRYGFDENNIHQLLLIKGFQPYNYDAFGRKLNQTATYGSNNTIYCRDMDFINERLQQAAGINVMGEVI